MKKIVLLCNAGMSTSLLVTNMEDYAKKMGYEYEINAYSISEMNKRVPGVDYVVLGPQVQYFKDKVKKVATCPVSVVDMRTYGKMDGEAVLKQVRKDLGED